MELFNDPLVHLKDGELLYYPHFFPPEEADRYFHSLLSTIDWKQEGMMMYGKPVLFPRLMAWYGDEGSSYAFSGKRYEPAAWTKELLEIKAAVAAISGGGFNSVLLNRYRNGNDSMGWHADNEPELGVDPLIASVNFGATRRFLMRHKYEGLKYEVELTHGALLVMRGRMQHFWEHQVPKTKKEVGERLNLTFRKILMV